MTDRTYEVGEYYPLASPQSGDVLLRSYNGDKVTTLVHVGLMAQEKAIRDKLIELGWTPPEDNRAARYDKLIALGRCDSKHGAGCVLSESRTKALMVFRYWCEPEVVNEMLDNL